MKRILLSALFATVSGFGLAGAQTVMNDQPISPVEETEAPIVSSEPTLEPTPESNETETTSQPVESPINPQPIDSPPTYNPAPNPTAQPIETTQPTQEEVQEEVTPPSQDVCRTCNSIELE